MFPWQPQPENKDEFKILEFKNFSKCYGLNNYAKPVKAIAKSACELD